MALHWSLLLVIVSGALGASLPKAGNYDDDLGLSLTELVTKHGYPVESYTVTTSDGYKLKVYRIPYGKNCGPNEPRKPPVLLQHGLLSNAIDYLISGEENGLGYILADDCFDVWLGNSRGNFESKNHTDLSPEEDKFWKFSWHEMGEYDLPAVIQFIINTSGQEKIHYIGHSQGTTQFFVYASMFPEESAAKVISMHALAPIAFMEHIYSPLLRWSADHLNQLEGLLAILGWNQFLPQSDFIAAVGGAACTDAHPNLERLCENVLFILCGYDSVQMNDALLPLITVHDPAGASTRQLLHYGQEITSTQFRRYDHGPVENLIHYGKLEPPRYEIENIRVPSYLHWGENDWMTAEEDVQKLADTLPIATLHKVPFAAWNHLDFLWANEVKVLLYDLVVEQLNQDSKDFQ